MACSRLIRRLMDGNVLLSLVTAAAFAQSPAQDPKASFKAPPEVDQALRARVTEFFQYHVDGNFRKAYEIVAEETKDYYFAAQKVRFEGFRITGVRFVNDECTKAAVDLETHQKMQRIYFKGVVVPVPMTTLWKIEGGKWVWYRDPDNPELTPMGRSDLEKVRQGTDEQTAAALKRLTDPAEIERKGNEILKGNKQSGLDRPDVTLAIDKPSSAVVSFHNGWPGGIQLVLDPGAALAGFTAKLDKTNLGLGEDAVLKLSYSPLANGAGLVQVPAQAQVRLIVQPFNLVYPVTVKFANQ
jgi:hypothetical protein